MNDTYKIRKVGRTFVITLPEEARKALRLKAGDGVRVEYSQDAGQMTVRRTNQDLEAARKRRYCGNCAASLTSTDYSAGECTQCHASL